MKSATTWREAFLRCCGPGILGGITFGDWLRLLRENRFALAPSKLPRAVMITVQSLQNSLWRWIEQSRYARALEQVQAPPPLFVLGHWRSGTTHLHNLLTVDQRFAFPNNYQTLFPHSFLTTEPLHARLVDWFLPRHRPMDNVEWSMQSPQEDEFALCITTFLSPYMGWFFPKRRAYYDRYLTLRETSAREIVQWQAGMLAFVKRLTYKLKRPLVLKSPPHTCRIKLLLQIFPEAKFVHIHRHPYEVFQSTRKMLTANFKLQCLQTPRLDDLDEWILQHGRALYEAYFDERRLIPRGHLHEVAYAELEREPKAQLQRVYEALSLPAFAEIKSQIESYVCSLEGYKKNQFSSLNEELKRRVASEWRVCFEQWGYPI